MKRWLPILLAIFALLTGCAKKAPQESSTPLPVATATATPTPVPTPSPTPEATVSAEATAPIIEKATSVTGTVSNGVFTSDRFTLTLPEGFAEQTLEGMTMYVPSLFPLDLGIVTIMQTGYEDKFESFTQEDYAKYLQASYEQLGLEAELKNASFEQITMDGADALLGKVQVTMMGFTLDQTLYTVKDGQTIYTIAYSQTGSDRDAEFKASADSFQFIG